MDGTPLAISLLLAPRRRPLSRTTGAVLVPAVAVPASTPTLTATLALAVMLLLLLAAAAAAPLVVVVAAVAMRVDLETASGAMASTFRAHPTLAWSGISSEPPMIPPSSIPVSTLRSTTTSPLRLQVTMSPIPL